MILDALYQLKKAEGKSKTRFNVTHSTGNYEAFELLKNAKGQLFFYYCDVPDRFKADVKRKADKIISNRFGKNVSSVFVPDISLPFGYGDVHGTNDAILLFFNSDQTEIEILVAKGKRNNRLALYHLLTDSDSELQTEIDALRKAVKPTA
jgi:hypothetical protein